MKHSVILFKHTKAMKKQFESQLNLRKVMMKKT